MRLFLIAICILAGVVTSNAQPHSYNDVRTKVGAAVIIPDGTVIKDGNHKGRVPMQSVYKFHLALAVLQQVDVGRLDLSQTIDIAPGELPSGTWSPIRDRYPEGCRLTLAEVLRYTVAESDNNGCDILFRLVGGTRNVHKYIRSLGVKQTSIRATEEQMRENWNVQYKNYTTPTAMAKLLADFDAGKLLSSESTAFLRRIMTETTTGGKRIKGLLPPETPVAHKTGSSGVNAEGLTAATNDVGIVTLPDGRHYIICVFVIDSKEDAATNERIIAELSLTFWNILSNYRCSPTRSL